MNMKKILCLYKMDKKSRIKVMGIIFLGILSVIFSSTYVLADLPVTFSTDDIQSISAAPLTEDSFVLAYVDDTNNDVSFKIYQTDGTELVGETDVDETAGACTSRNCVSVSAFNSTHFVIGWVDTVSNTASFSVYMDNGTQISGPIAAASIGTSMAVAEYM